MLKSINRKNKDIAKVASFLVHPYIYTRRRALPRYKGFDMSTCTVGQFQWTEAVLPGCPSWCHRRLVWVTASLNPPRHSCSLNLIHKTLCFSCHFSRWTWLSRCLLKQRMMEVVVTAGAISRTKLQSNRHHQQTNTQFYRPDALTVAQPTVSKHWRGKIRYIKHVI